MLTTLKALLLAAKLLALPVGGTPYGTEKICQEYYPGRDLDDPMIAECACQLSTWQCEAQGWCSDEETAPYQAVARGLPDPYRIELGCR